MDRDIRQPERLEFCQGYASGPHFCCCELAEQVFGPAAAEPCLTHAAYLYRRFGPPFRGSDPGKEIAQWTLSTGIKGLYFWVSCKAGSLRLDFGVLYTRELSSTFPRDGANESVLACRKELVACFQDLLRPVFVRDIPINLLGRCSDEVMRDAKCAEPSAYAGYAPSREAMDAMLAEEADV